MTLLRETSPALSSEAEAQLTLRDDFRHSEETAKLFDQAELRQRIFADLDGAPADLDPAARRALITKHLAEAKKVATARLAAA